MGSATALTQFARSIGATLGVTLMGVIVNQRLPEAAQLHRQSIHRLPPDLRNGLAHALQPAFLAAAAALRRHAHRRLLLARRGAAPEGARRDAGSGDTGGRAARSGDPGSGSEGLRSAHELDRLHADQGVGPPRALRRQREAVRLLLRARARVHADGLCRPRDGLARPRLVRPRPERDPARPHERPAPRQRDHPLCLLARRRGQGRRAQRSERHRGLPPGGAARREKRHRAALGRGRARARRAGRRSRPTARTSTPSSTATTTRGRTCPGTGR